jgi:protein-S-isoprenylcysteine O-methyltransferase Ste14
MNFFDIVVWSSVILWVILVIYWIIRAKERGVGNEIAGLLKLVVSGVIIYVPLISGINRFSYDRSMPVSVIGLIIAILGCMVCIAGREELAKNWSGKVAIQRGHELVQNGIYGMIRHPIYAGVLMMMLGVSMIAGNVFGFIWTALSFFGFFRKSKQEETLLLEKFGIIYAEYCKKTKIFFPFIL